MEKRNDARETILAKIKKSLPQPRPLPAIPQFEIPGDALQNFIAHLKGYDGEYRLFDTRQEAVDWLNKSVANQDRTVFSAVADVKGNVSAADFPTQGDMHTIDVCVAQATMAVGETGSLLVDTASLGEPAAALFSTDLFLLVDRQSMVSSLQQAYENMDLTSQRYTALFSGPSATADIEAVHVTGAQGEISLTALLYNCTESDRSQADEIDERLPQGTPLGQPDSPHLKLRRETDPSAGRDSV